MHEPTRRRFSLLDAMVLVAATAVGLPLMRSFFGVQFYVLRIRNPGAYYLHWGALGLHGLSGCAVAWSVALILLGPVRYRTRPARLFRRPGTVAVVAAGVMALLTGLLFLVAYALERSLAPAPQAPFYFTMLAPGQIGAGVLCSWLMLALSGRWRPEPSWIDRLGRALGVYWILTIFGTYWLLVD
jgi:hypothetical protein